MAPFSNIFSNSFALWAPILFASIGCLIMQKAGVLNWGVDGVMIFGGLCYALVIKTESFKYHHVHFLGFFFAFLIGIGLGLIHAVLTVTLKGNHFFVSFIWNYLAPGISTLILIFSYQQKNLDVSDIFLDSPDFLKAGTLLIIFNLILVVSVIWFFTLTKQGLHLKATGQRPIVLALQKINITKIQYLAVICGFSLMTLAGAFFTYQKGSFNSTVDNIGLLAFAIVVLSQWSVLKTVFFSFFLALFLEVTGFLKQINNKWWMVILGPAVLLLLVPLFANYKNDDCLPKMINTPYIKEKK